MKYGNKEEMFNEILYMIAQIAEDKKKLDKIIEVCIKYVTLKKK